MKYTKAKQKGFNNKLNMKNKKNIYMATIQVAVMAKSPDEVCDGIHELLQENPPEFILDWKYTGDLVPAINGGSTYTGAPVYYKVAPILKKYKEGDVFND